MTYSIVARDARSGELGVAVQSHYFQVGPVVPWARAGVGAVATQSMVDVRYGPIGLELMRAGRPAAAALAAAIAADEEPEVRQVAMVDAEGRVAAHTGSRCIAEAGHRTGDGYSVQANLMLRATVWDRMAEAFEAAEGPLAERLLAAIEAAEADGGDIRGRQSAAILVVTGQPSGRWWEDRLIDLRVEDHPEPIPEMARLLRLKRAYDAEEESEYERALKLAPEKTEIKAWAAFNFAEAGRMDEAARLFSAAVAEQPAWIETMRRLVAAGRLEARIAEELERRAGALSARPR